MIAATMVEAIAAFQTLREMGGKEISSQHSFTVKRLMKKLSTEVDLFNEAEFELLVKFGAAKDGSLKVKDENFVTFNRERLQLLKTVVEFDSSPLTAEIFGQKIAPNHALGLGPFLKDPEDK